MAFLSSRGGRTLAVLGLALGVAGVFAAEAQGRQERPRLVLQALDLNHDGSLSADEIKAASTSLLTLDRNGDGQITQDELDAPRTDAGASPDQLVEQLMAFDKDHKGYLVATDLPERMRALFTRSDKNQDGKLTPDEIRATVRRTGSPNGRPTGPGTASGQWRLDPLLNALDLNHDGVLDAAEIAAASSSLMVLDANHDGVIDAAEMRVRQQTPAERAAHMLDEWDTNKDGKLSKDEVPDGMKSRFDAADLNHDGFLDKDELVQMFATMPAQGQGGGGPRGENAPAQPKGKQD